MLICSGSKDSFKIWDIYWSRDYPIFSFDTSKKWVYDCVFDPSILSLMVNIEGKFFSHNIFSITSERIIEKKFNIFDENTTSTASHPNNPNIFIASINGLIYSLSKMNIMNMEKIETPDSKGKSKWLKTQNVFLCSKTAEANYSFIDNDEMLDEVKEVSSETYLYKENWVSIEKVLLCPSG